MVLTDEIGFVAEGRLGVSSECNYLSLNPSMDAADASVPPLTNARVRDLILGDSNNDR